MQKWEYKYMFHDTHGYKLFIDGKVVADGTNIKTINYLQNLGDEGWELTGIVSECFTNGGIISEKWTGINYYFKRPKP
jgi:hypothetical protein